VAPGGKKIPDGGHPCPQEVLEVPEQAHWAFVLERCGKEPLDLQYKLHGSRNGHCFSFLK
jgi:hypothetical protein